MRIWKKYVVPGIAAITVVLLGGAGASGADEMANARITHPAAVTTVAAHTGQLSLRHLVLLGLAKGSLPGGPPYDDLQEETREENYQEATVRLDSAASGSRRTGA
ncbi:hypothetical protein QFZ35_000502 [Arthrobacter ulcerisalmonis]|nr:hypothetical protein [Arthrobacter ulcerisalmonis]MDQ0662004.1 hypothetical protein [Arthrobacter ulcerisalmonis]